MRSRRNHDVRSLGEFAACSIHRKTERAREYGDVFVVPVPVQRNNDFAAGAKAEDEAAGVGRVPVEDCPFGSVSHRVPCQTFHEHSLAQWLGGRQADLTLQHTRQFAKQRGAIAAIGAAMLTGERGGAERGQAFQNSRGTG